MSDICFWIIMIETFIVVGMVIYFIKKDKEYERFIKSRRIDEPTAISVRLTDNRLRAYSVYNGEIKEIEVTGDIVEFTGFNIAIFE